MKYDHKLVRESNKKRAETELKEAIKKALKTDLYYEDICEIVAKAINEASGEKELKEIAKRDANRFCNRNKVYEIYDSSVADMIKKLYITTYLRARHQIMSEINQKTPEEVFEEGIKFPNLKVMKTESFRFKGSEPNIAELPVSKEKGL